uniref:GTP binding protein 2b n=1 Tax=Hucho hucho TaxID=62062 RepID=A0A4W5P3M8_9TELE
MLQDTLFPWWCIDVKYCSHSLLWCGGVCLSVKNTIQAHLFKTCPSFCFSQAEEGNIEYKLKLVNPTQYRFEHLATQLKWRLQEGWGEAVYQIGVEDNGLLVGLSEGDMRASLKTLRRMAEKVGADITLLREREVDYDSDRNCRKIAEVLVRKVPDDQQFLDLRVAVLGNVDSGKSTLLGVLTQGELDNGRGRARLNLFSISFEILGFNSKGEVVNYSDSRTAEEICESSSKMITFIDLAGHHKYLKTTIFGLTSYCPDFAMLVVSANTGIAGTTREHLGLAMALKVPIFIVVSKVDLCAKGTVERTVRQLEHVLKLPGCNKVPMVVARQDDAVTAAQQFGMVMVSPKMNPTICWQFEAAIVLLFHAKTFRRGFQVTVHVGNVRQTATVECLHGKVSLVIIIINWVVRVLNADWLTAVVYQPVYHEYDKTFIFTALITLVNSL